MAAPALRPLSLGAVLGKPGNPLFRAPILIHPSEMFDSLSGALNKAYSALAGSKTLTDKNIDDGIRAVRQALLEADVNFKVAKDFIKQVKHRALGEEVIKAVNPGDQFVKIFHDELTELLGGGSHPAPRCRYVAPDSHDGRSARCRQDDDLRQARALVAPQEEEERHARRGGPPAPGGRRSARHPRQAARHSRARRGDERPTARGVPAGYRGSEAAVLRRRHPRHRGSPAHRRGVDDRARGDSEEMHTAWHPARV